MSSLSRLLTAISLVLLTTFSLANVPLPKNGAMGDLPELAKRRVIRVLVVPSKTSYFVDQGTQRGVTYETFKAFEDDYNTRNKTGLLRVHVVFVPVARDRLLTDLVAGRGDIAAANITITAARDSKVDFTAPVYDNVREIVVTGPGAPPLTSIEALSGQEVFVRRSSSYWESLSALNARLAKSKKPPVKLKPAPEVLEDEDLLEMTNAGLAKIVIVDDHKAAFWTKVFPKIVPHPNLALREGGKIAWAIRQGSPKLKADLDNFIATRKVGTAFGNTLVNRYLKNVQYVKDATSDAERKKFEQMVQLFRKYGEMYKLDWLLMAAQGYQESRLDQRAKSHVGAVGVMQVMPATGKELAVGDIRQLEPNIHAGVKYIRFMVNKYYAQEPMTALDKHLFAFASYNAGPARIRKLRAEAKTRGLDPNRWFNHVETIVAERIGRETVQYVANIYKYYIAYTLLMEQRRQREAAKPPAK
ncbi:lytic transglycosylase F [Chitinolyticbacter albus]|uniref:transglycosylase SLT domain-containing protein n=1 Tax=Chitinolyticbacter albus TaxID=2961951 RepID=UPI0021092722|nr:lytic transglycosylase F [Chitinolyticbacter albus]